MRFEGGVHQIDPPCGWCAGEARTKTLVANLDLCVELCICCGLPPKDVETCRTVCSSARKRRVRF